ncbi:MAG: hypothetical protein Q9162_005032 [Coniocarpon cinnabarinum]
MSEPQPIALAKTITNAIQTLNDFYDEEHSELVFPEEIPTSEQRKSINDALEASLKLQRILQGQVGGIMSLSFPAAAFLSRAMEEHTDAADERRTAWGLANGAKRPMVEELQAEYPERAEHFAAFMKHNWSTQNPLQPLVDNYDWASLGSAHVVDVGGGLGHASIALAEAFPKLTFTVQDFETVVATGKQDLPEPLKGRIAFQAHDFFKPQSVEGADVYLFRSIFHDWPDEECIRILRNMAPALKKGAKVLLNDFVMPAPGELGFLQERRARTLDLIMTCLFNARERAADEWKPLFDMADPRFEFKGVKPSVVNRSNMPTKMLLSLIEAVWVGN